MLNCHNVVDKATKQLTDCVAVDRSMIQSQCPVDNTDYTTLFISRLTDRFDCCTGEGANCSLHSSCKGLLGVDGLAMPIPPFERTDVFGVVP